MKVFKILVSIISVLIVVFFIAVFVIINTIDIDQYKGQITKAISDHLHRNVALGDMDLSFSLKSGLVLDLKQLRIADLPEFSGQDMITIDFTRFDIDVFALLKEKTLSIMNVQMKNPKIIIVRGAQNRINIQSFTEDVSGNKPDASFPASSGQDPAEGASSQDENIKLLIRSVDIKNGTVIFQDANFSPPLNVQLSEADLFVSDFSLSSPFKFSLKLNFLGDQKNLSAEGAGQINRQTGQFSIKNVRAQMDIGTISMKKLFLAFPGFQMYIPQSIQGSFQVMLPGATFGGSDPMTLSLNGSLRDGAVKSSLLNRMIEKMNLDVQIDDTRVFIHDLSFRYGPGEVRLRGDINDYLHQQLYQFSLKAEKLALSDLIPANFQQVKMLGYLNAKYAVLGQGFADESLKMLSGQGEFDVQEGEVVDINIIRTVLERMTIIPGLVERIGQNLPEKYKEVLKQKNTVIKKLTLISRIENESLEIKDASLEAEGFSVSANGVLGFDQQLSLNSSVVIAEDLSRGMVSSAEELKYLLENESIRIPLRKYEGKLSEINIFPDLEHLGKKVIKSKGKEEIQKLLDKVLERSPEEQPSQDGQPQNQGQTQEPVRPEQEIIGNILDAIFR